MRASRLPSSGVDTADSVRYLHSVRYLQSVCAACDGLDTRSAAKEQRGAKQKKPAAATANKASPLQKVSINER